MIKTYCFIKFNAYMKWKDSPFYLDPNPHSDERQYPVLDHHETNSDGMQVA
jgi:hypothetical protein